MLPIERQDKIKQVLRSTHFVTTEDVAQLLDASVETIRRDFIQLEQRGVLSRVHGGATSAGPPFAAAEPSFADRRVLSMESKASIGRAAAGMVDDGHTVILDVGTTALEVAKALPATFHGTVATCSVLVAVELATRVGVQILLSGGRMRGGDLALSNSQTVQFFADLHADIAFLGSGGLHADAGLTDFYLDEVATRRVMISQSSRSFVLADQSKLGLIAPHRVCLLDQIDGVITDGVLQPDLQSALESSGGVAYAA